MDKQRRIRAQLGILEDAGHVPRPGAAILDLGCGKGDLVKAYRGLGYQAYGCDFQFKPGANVEKLHQQGIIRLIEGNPYRLPFDDGTFDFVLSDQVFEHVRNFPETLSEHRRILKPGGVGLHLFPSRYRPIEPHVQVPGATIAQSYWWLWLWAHLGVRPGCQRGLSAVERARRNRQYLSNHTNYLTKAELRKQFESCFRGVAFREDLFLKYSRRARFLHDLSRYLPFLPSVYSTLLSRVVLCRN